MTHRYHPAPWRIDPAMPGIVRFNDDPTTGILVGLRPNAALVSAAPELLEALIYLRQLVDRNVSPDAPQAIAQADAAIAKALDQ